MAATEKWRTLSGGCNGHSHLARRSICSIITLFPDLYFRRWQVEIYLRDLKITLKMDVLKCKTEEGVLKELAVFALVYNLVRSVACESARVQGVSADRVSVTDAVRWLVGAEGGEDLSMILINPSRKGRVEPRVRKRRPKQYPVMKKPRTILRKELTERKVPA